MAGGGQDISCGEKERINVNMINQTWTCVPVSCSCKYNKKLLRRSVYK